MVNVRERWRAYIRGDIDYRTKTYFAIALLMISYSFLYVLSYLILIESRVGMAVNTVALLLYAFFTFVIAGRHLVAAKIGQLVTIIGHLFAVSFIFSTRAGFHFYFILVPVIAFLFFEFEHLWERLVTFVFTGMSIAGFILCEVFATEVRSPGIPDGTFPYLFYSTIALIVIALFVALRIFSIALKKVEVRLVSMSTTDMLTGAHNRRYFIEHAEIELARSHRYKNPLALLMMDIDHFKMINDSFGHHEGDRALQAVVASCQDTVRCTDVFARVGGEEFAALLVDACAKDAVMIADRIRDRISRLSIPTEKDNIQLTMSVGLTFFRDRDEDLNDMLREADSELYRAKKNGRNRVAYPVDEVDKQPNSTEGNRGKS